jgi:tRNA(Ile)-lysidine synthase TilS/MesJ
MFSGGLDSTIAAHLLKQQGLNIKLLHFVLPFYSGLDIPHEQIKKYATQLDLPLQIEEEGDEYISMMKDLKFGFGKNANPCVDCRIHRLTKAKKIMEKEGAQFIATGEVVGQRPMSQRADVLHTIENRAGVKGIILRPLSAHLMNPLKVELDGIVKRELLWGVSGRGRKPQLEYAKLHNLKHSAPAGGCMLTDVGSSRRFHEFVKFTPDYNLNDFKLLAYGRHFRIKPDLKLIIARNESENNLLEQLLAPYENYLQMADTTGPVSLLRGNYSKEDIEFCGSILARFSKEREKETVRVEVVQDDVSCYYSVKPFDEETVEKYRI